MSAIDKLASSLDRRDEVPNQELAEQIVTANDKKSVKELVANLANKNKDIQADCIKTLYEIGERKPALIAGYAKDFVALLDSKNNRMQWGAMTALSSIAALVPDVLYPELAKIVAASDNGSVITKDHCVKILLRVGAVKQYGEDTFALLTEQLANSPVNQFPTYAEGILQLVNENNKDSFMHVLRSRLPEIEQDSKRKRVEKVIAKLLPLNKAGSKK